MAKKKNPVKAQSFSQVAKSTPKKAAANAPKVSSSKTVHLVPNTGGKKEFAAKPVTQLATSLSSAKGKGKGKKSVVKLDSPGSSS